MEQEIYEFTVLMGLVDFVPVILYLISLVLLQRDLYNKMPKYAFACFAAGTINVFTAGFLKESTGRCARHKTLPFCRRHTEIIHHHIG